MLQERIRRQQQARQLEAVIAAMPAYPIYREARNRYVIYADGEPLAFPTESTARLGQLVARERWLRTRGWELSQNTRCPQRISS